MLRAKGLGSVRVFPIFGSYDFIIRAWLHPSITTEFRTWLDAALSKAAGSHNTYPFAVDYIDQRAHNQPDIDRDLLEELKEDTIKAVQAGRELPLLQRLIEGNLVIRKKRSNNVRFFTSIYLDDENQPINVGVVAAIKQYLRDSPGIRDVSIYRGYGFCSVLVKGEVDSFFNIAPMPNHIGDLYRPLGAHTETYLLHGASHVAGDESIGDATFFALQGRNLFVQSIIPELYDLQSPNRQAVERLLVSAAHRLTLTQQDKKLLHDYLLGFLAEDSTQMATVLFAIFHKLEGYLRANHKEFIGRKNVGTFDAICDRANIPPSTRDRPSLRDLLHVLTTTIKLVDTPEQYQQVSANWDEFGQLRNDLVHAKVDVIANWDTLIKRLLQFLPKIRELLRSVEAITGKEYDGVY